MTLAFRDLRWNSWRWRPILDRWGFLNVFINPDLLKTAAFLVETNTGKLVSTAFFVKMPLGNPDSPEGYADYAVTTRHSLKRAPLSIRVNETWGGRHDEPTNLDDWIPSRDTDVAVLPIRFPIREFDLHFIFPFEMATDKHYLLATKKGIDTTTFAHRYGAGDEVFSVGLFSGHPGENTIHPAARFGNIAMVPVASEKIMAHFGEFDPVTGEPQLEPIEAFLVEISAMHGQSGSPVFLRPWVDQEDRRDQRPISEFNFLVGMIQGFYPMELDSRIQNRKLKLTVDAGMAIVIPSRIIHDMLMEDDLVKERERQLEKVRKERRDKAPKPAPASLPKPEEPSTFTEESFTDALQRASRKVAETSEPESKRSRTSE